MTGGRELREISCCRYPRQSFDHSLFVNRYWGTEAGNQKTSTPNAQRPMEKREEAGQNLKAENLKSLMAWHTGGDLVRLTERIFLSTGIL